MEKHSLRGRVIIEIDIKIINVITYMAEIWSIYLALKFS